MEKNRSLFIKLYPEVSSLTKNNPPIASFIIRVVSSLGNRTTLAHPGIFSRNQALFIRLVVLCLLIVIIYITRYEMTKC